MPNATKKLEYLLPSNVLKFQKFAVYRFGAIKAERLSYTIPDKSSHVFFNQHINSGLVRG